MTLETLVIWTLGGAEAVQRGKAGLVRGKGAWGGRMPSTR